MLSRVLLFLGLLASFAIAQLTSADVQAFLGAHNTVRSQHGALPLVWDPTLAAYAQQWAANCNTVHSHGSYGENLFWGTAWAYGIPDSVKYWADEASSYSPKNPTYSHFTQVVWKSTTQLGCGVQICGEDRFIVCEYFPAGNVVGQISQNVDA